LGDQYGALLAGAYSLYSDGLVTAKAAQDWVNAQDWNESQELVSEKDQLQCMKHIAQSIVRTDRGERQIAELVELACQVTQDSKMDENEARRTLRRYGIARVSNAQIAISNTSTALARILADTQWHKNWSRILKRIDGATARGGDRFDTTRCERSVVIPVDVFLAE
jgi:putative DNA primase/helicase